MDRKSTHPHFYNKIKQQQCIIQDHIWLGTNAIVLCGVINEQHSIVAAGAVVNRFVTKYSIVGGVPAREIIKQSLV